MKRLVLIGLMLVALGLACGKKGSPRAPELVLPETITNLTARPAPDHNLLTWSRPLRDAEGKEIKDLTGFVIFRKEVSPTCLECPAPYRQLTTVSVEDRGKIVKQKQYRFIDDEVQPKLVYRYRVASQLSDGTLSPPSNEVEVTRGP
jgi:hypothetical protein